MKSISDDSPKKNILYIVKQDYKWFIKPPAPCMMDCRRPPTAPSPKKRKRSNTFTVLVHSVHFGTNRAGTTRSRPRKTRKEWFVPSPLEITVWKEGWRRGTCNLPKPILLPRTSPPTTWALLLELAIWVFQSLNATRGTGFGFLSRPQRALLEVVIHHAWQMCEPLCISESALHWKALANSGSCRKVCRTLSLLGAEVLVAFQLTTRSSLTLSHMDWA